MAGDGTVLTPFLVCSLLAFAAACDDRSVDVLEAPANDGSASGAAGAPAAEPRREERAGGLLVETQEPGRGPPAARGDRLTVHVEGRLAEDGAVFESSRQSGIPTVITLGRREVVPGLERGLFGARAGARLVLRVPAALAYGDRGMGRVPPGADLVFDVHVMRID